MQLQSKLDFIMHIMRARDALAQRTRSLRLYCMKPDFFHSDLFSSICEALSAALAPLNVRIFSPV